jgi:SAM-dependent methyltransferase
MLKYQDLENPNSLRSKFRKRRIKHLVSVVSSIIEKEKLSIIKICDVGGNFRYWRNFPFKHFEGTRFEITLVNISQARIYEGGIPFPDNVVLDSKIGDACNLVDFTDKQFDLCHSNSVIEHVGGWDNIKQMRDEVLRIGKYYFVQTPNYWFPVEPHYVLPVIHFLPRPVHTRLLMWLKKTDFDHATGKFEENRMLSKKEFLFIFPGSKLLKERYILVKSYTVVSSSLYK